MRRELGKSGVRRGTTSRPGDALEWVGIRRRGHSLACRAPADGRCAEDLTTAAPDAQLPRRIGIGILPHAIQFFPLTECWVCHPRPFFMPGAPAPPVGAATGSKIRAPA